MPKEYRCRVCGKVCTQPVYLRLQFTRCGLPQASHQRDRQTWLSVGHLCEECLSMRVHWLINDNLELTQPMTPLK
jgi:hypothetical protein